MTLTQSISLPRFLVITAKTDESQFPLLIDSLSKQRDVVVIHEVVEGLDSISAEKRIYELAVFYKNGVDYVIKLDADMVILDVGLLHFLSRLFRIGKDWMRITFPVEDYYTARQIIGVHCWRAFAVPDVVRIAAPRPDSWIDRIPGMVFSCTNYRYVSHGYDPSISQAIRFGLHRAIKAHIGGSGHVHWLTIRDLGANLDRNRSESGLLAAFAAVRVYFENLDDFDWSAVDSNSAQNKKLKIMVKNLLSSEDQFDVRPELQFLRWKQLESKGLQDHLKFKYKLVKRGILVPYRFLSWLITIFRYIYIYRSMPVRGAKRSLR